MPHVTSTITTPCPPRAPVVPATPQVTDFYTRIGKSMVDRALAAGLLVLLLPLMLLTALAVHLSLGGPVIFGQTRVGRAGRRFTVYKFRSMHADRRRVASSTYAGPERRIRHKSLEDPRLTPTGRLLRRLSLDELPQLINVLRGDMSMVGPRPELPAIVDAHYRPGHHRRHDVKPGLTGLWQVSERGNGTMMHEHIDVDLDYVDRISFGRDLRIMLRTLPAALTTNQGI